MNSIFSYCFVLYGGGLVFVSALIMGVFDFAGFDINPWFRVITGWLCISIIWTLLRFVGAPKSIWVGALAALWLAFFPVLDMWAYTESSYVLLGSPEVLHTKIEKAVFGTWYFKFLSTVGVAGLGLFFDNQVRKIRANWYLFLIIIYY